MSRTGPLLIAVLAAAALAGCGGGDDEAASSLDEALGYLPEDAGFVFIASTDLEDYDDVDKILGKFPFGGQAKDALKNSFESEGADFDDDVKPLLGNEVVVGTDDNASFVDSESDTSFVLALEAKDAGKLEDLAKDGTDSRGETEGYDVYETESGETWLAVKDEVVVLSDEEETLENALKQRGEDDRLTEDDVEPAFEGLPEDAPARAYVNVKALLAADPDVKDALKIKWVDHIETLGIAGSVTEDEIAIDYRLATDPEGLTEEDLPLASGSGAPQVFEREDGSAEIVLGLRDPGRSIEFAQAAAEAVDPTGFGQFAAGKEQIGRRLGIDVDQDVIAQLSGNVAVVATLDQKFGLRAEVEDPAAFEKTLAKAMDGLPGFADGLTVTKPGRGEDLYGVATEDGRTYALGVSGDAFVLANDAKLAGEVATRPLESVDGAQGAFVATADAEQLANDVIAKFGGGLQGIGASLFTGPLGDIVSSASSSTEGITGRLSLEIE